MLLLDITDLSFPLDNPVLKFFLILLIILFAPVVFNRFKIPALMGLIIAGALIGPNGFNIILRDSGIVMSGAVGLLYIMFLAGLEIDLTQFKKNSFKSVVFGLYTFIVPMALGIFAGLYILNFELFTSILLASLFASHTLITYPLISKLGLTKSKAVNIAVGGTVITDTLALLVLAVIVGLVKGNVDSSFWIELSLSIFVFGLFIILIFPLLARWFFKHFDDSVTQYIFVLALVFCGAVLAEIAGVEGIIGAFLVGLTLNRLIPRTSTLMSRIEFVGNAIFIPFFLIGVGMLIDYRAFFSGYETALVATVMTVIATGSKYIASWMAQKSFKFSRDERRVVFGLSNAQAAATLAVVTVGYNVIIGVDNLTGEPIRLLGESVLNGSILMILVTCTIASFATQKGADNLLLEKENAQEFDSNENINERILIALRYLDTAEELVGLSGMIKSQKSSEGLYALHVLGQNSKEADQGKETAKILEVADKAAADADKRMNTLLRYDINSVNGITGVVKENKITDLVLGLHKDKGASKTFLGNLTEGILLRCNTTTFVYKPVQPIATVKRHVVIVPENADKELGFAFWLVKLWNIAKNSGTKLVFYAPDQILKIIKDVHKKFPVEASFIQFDDWDDFLIVSRDIKTDDNIIIVLSRKHKPSYRANMDNIPVYMNKYFNENSFILIYPMQSGVGRSYQMNLRNPSLMNLSDRKENIYSNIKRLFRNA